VYQASVRSATAGTTKTFLAFVAILSLVLSFFATANPVTATDDHTVGLTNGAGATSDCGQGNVTWHFVANQISGGTDQSAELTATFEDSSGNQYTVSDPDGGEPKGNGQTWHFYVTTTEDATLIDATATFGDSQTDAANLVLSGEPMCEAAPDLTIEKSANASSLDAGDPFSYTITVTNTGDASATGVVITDDLDDSLAVDSATFSVDGGTATDCTVGAGNTISCDVGELAAGSSAVATVSVTTSPASCPSVSNVATVSSEELGSEDSNEVTVDVACAPDLTVEKSASASVVDAGDAFMYTITVENTGDAAATGVSITDDLDDTLTGVSATFSVDGGAATDCTVASGNAVSCDVGDLAAGSTVTATVSVTTTEDSCPSVSNVSSVSSNELPSEDSNEVVVSVECAGVDTSILEIHKFECLAADSGTVIDEPEYHEPVSFRIQTEGTGDGTFDGIGDCRLPDGVTFDVYTDINELGALDGELETTAVGTLTTENGIAELELGVGSYILVEPATDLWPGGWVAFDIVDGSWTTIDVTNNIGVIGSVLIAKQDEAGAPLGDAGFTIGDMGEVLDNGEGDMDARAGFVCVDGLDLGSTLNVSETTVPDGYEGAADQSVDVTVDADCASRTEGPDATFVNTAVETGSVKVVKYFCTVSAPEGFDNPDFQVLSGDVTVPTLPDQFAENCSRGGDNPEATFSLDGTSGETTNGILIYGDVPLGSYTLSETAPMTGSTDEGAIVLDEAGQIVTVLVINFEEEHGGELGSLLIAKEDEAGELLGGATFAVDGAEHADADMDGFVCVDGLALDSMVSVEETIAPDGYIGEDGAKDATITSADDCETRLAGEDPQADADVTFVNAAEEAQTGSITVNKEIECNVCETRTPGYYFNQGENNAGTAFAEESLSSDPITVGGFTFDSVQSVQDNAKPGSLLRHYLALVLNVRMADGTDCDLSTAVYSGSVEALDGLTVGAILDEAEAVLNSGDSIYSEEQLHDAIDEINNASETDNGALSCSTTGTAGFEFTLTDEADMTWTGTTGEDGSYAFEDLPLGVYTLEETGGPDGTDCMVVDASGTGVEFDAETGIVTITLTEENADVSVTVVNDCGGENGGGGAVGSITVAKATSDETDATFGFDFNGTSFQLGSGEWETFGNLEAGTYTAAEMVGELSADWSLDSIDCVTLDGEEEIGDANALIDLGAGTADVTLAEGEDVLCVFLNAMEQEQGGELGSITITKIATGTNGSSTSFGFTSDVSGSESFSLTGGASATMADLADGTYTVTEGTTTGWRLATLACTAGGSVDLASRTATVTIADGADVTCVFTNVVSEGTQGGGGGGTSPNQGGQNQGQTPREGTLGGTLPNTALNAEDGVSIPAALLALLLLGGLAGAGHLAVAEARRRR
jgi:uncharacterized repeat protein (TIGR01451 family)